MAMRSGSMRGTTRGRRRHPRPSAAEQSIARTPPRFSESESKSRDPRAAALEARRAKTRGKYKGAK